MQRVQLWKGLHPSALSEAVSHFTKVLHCWCLAKLATSDEELHSMPRHAGARMQNVTMTVWHQHACSFKACPKCHALHLVQGFS